MDFVRYEVIEDHVALVTLDRPDRLNALGSQMRAEFQEALQLASADDGVRAIIVTGAGDHFCAGADVKEWAEHGSPVTPSPPVLAEPNVHGTHDIIKPMIAAVRGYCLGGGLNLVLTLCDIRIAGEGARFGMPEVARGVIDLTTPFAGEHLPRTFLAELLFTADPVDAERAREAGLVNEVVPDDEVLPAALAVARRIVRHSPAAVQATKLNLLKTFEATESARRWEADLSERSFSSDEARAAMREFADGGRD